MVVNNLYIYMLREGEAGDLATSKIRNPIGTFTWKTQSLPVEIIDRDTFDMTTEEAHTIKRYFYSQ